MPRHRVLRALLQLPLLGLGLGLGLGSAACLAENGKVHNCESIRGQIDAKIRASGAKGYTVTVVGADAKAAGEVVGSCDLGTKRIVYMRTGTASAPATPPGRRTPDDDVITECRDGRVVRGGDCGRP